MTAIRTAVLGAGALGLTVAYRLALLGDSVTVIEREPEPWGLAAGFPVATAPDGSAVYLEKYYHHIFQSDRAAIGLIEELGLGDRLVWPPQSSTILRDGQVHPLNGALDLLRLPVLPFPDRVRLGAVMAYLKLEKGYQRLEGRTAESWLQRWMGRNAYSVFAEPLLRQKFGTHAGEVAMPWFWSRVHLRSFALGYLLGGFPQIYNRLAERIAAHGGTVHLGTTVERIGPAVDGGVVVRAAGKDTRFDRVISTLPAAVTFALTPELPGDFTERYRPGPALGAHCLVLELDRQVTEHYWIAINDPGYPFLAVVEHTNYIPPAEYNGKHLMYVGNYLPMDHPLFRQSGEEILAGFLPYLQRLNPGFDRSWVRAIHSFSAPFAQPVVTTGYKEHIPPFATPIPNLYMASMFGVYPQDRGQNYSIVMAERLLRRLQRGSATEAERSPSAAAERTAGS